MLFNQFAEGCFSAIAASFNPAFERACQKRRAAQLNVDSVEKFKMPKSACYKSSRSKVTIGTHQCKLAT